MNSKTLNFVFSILTLMMLTVTTKLVPVLPISWINNWITDQIKYPGKNTPKKRLAWLLYGYLIIPEYRFFRYYPKARSTWNNLKYVMGKGKKLWTLYRTRHKR
jgi:hypothetical protein